MGNSKKKRRKKKPTRYWPHEQVFEGDENFPGEDTFEQMYFIFRKRDKGKIETNVSYKYRKYLGSRLTRLSKQIDENTWKPHGTNKFYTMHPRREINAPYYEDRIVEFWLDYFYFIPFSEPMLIDNNNACRVGKGMTDCNKKIREALFRLIEINLGFYVVQTDILGYFDNIKHDFVKEIFEGLDPHAFGVLLKILAGWHKEKYIDEEENVHYIGLPKGCVVSQRVGVVALDPVDHMIYEWEKTLFYVRIMDDILVFVQTKEDAKQCLQMIRDKLTTMDAGISLHPKKTQYYPFRPMKANNGKNKNRGIVFCGWRYHLREDNTLEVTVRNSTKRNFKMKMKRLKKEVESGEITAASEEYKKQCCINYLKGSRKHGLRNDTEKLQQYLEDHFDFMDIQEKSLNINKEEQDLC